MIKGILSLLIVLFCLIFSVQAQHFDHDQTSIVQQVGLSALEKKLVDYLDIERKQLEYKHPVPTTAAWKDFARLYEEYVNLFCFAKNSQAIASGSKIKLSLNCKYYLGKLEKYQADNILISCARNGVYSEECHNAYLLQTIAPEDKNLSVQNTMQDFEKKVASIIISSLKLDINAIKGRLPLVKKAYSEVKSIHTWAEMNNILRYIVFFECQEKHIVQVDFQPPSYTHASNLLEHEKYASDALYNQVYELLHDPDRLGNLYTQGKYRLEEEAVEEDTEIDPFMTGVSTNENVFKAKPFWRIRSINKKCYDVILEGIKFNNYFPPSICSLHGEFSPFCITAKKEWDAKKHWPEYVKNPPKDKPTYQSNKF